jgi:hypothetical protein
MTGVTLLETHGRGIVCVPAELALLCPSRDQTPAGGPEHVPVMVYTQVVTTFFLYFLPPDLVGLEAGLCNA